MSRPFVPFRFQVSLTGSNLPDGLGPAPLCGGGFSEATGLEATMTPRSIREGGRNFGQVQRAGPTAFGTVTLKRGVTSPFDLWTWFNLVTNREAYGRRLNGRIDVYADTAIALTWKLVNVLPVKFKAPDLSATATQVAIEEVQLVFEQLTMEPA
ncbi:phage tail protein [Rhodopila sp.]|jgi:phage tail-like protein|uniref:phage tail protein n=1 Tax=Rhodopila sp. TaxID=2480087 RepID=UPI002CF086D0|nr:phage tail protein [Rhodopila sp.]HVZ08872.1 phage tail protein [Rhodopila sp.]